MSCALVPVIIAVILYCLLPITRELHGASSTSMSHTMSVYTTFGAALFARAVSVVIVARGVRTYGVVFPHALP